MYSTVCMPCCTGTSIGTCNSTVKIGQLLYDLLQISKVLACAAAAADQIKIGPVLIGLTRTPFLSAGSVGSEFVIVSLGQTCMIDRCFDSRMQLNVQLMSKGPSRNSTTALPVRHSRIGVSTRRSGYPYM